MSRSESTPEPLALLKIEEESCESLSDTKLNFLYGDTYSRVYKARQLGRSRFVLVRAAHALRESVEQRSNTRRQKKKASRTCDATSAVS